MTPEIMWTKMDADKLAGFRASKFATVNRSRVSRLGRSMLEIMELFAALVLKAAAEIPFEIAGGAGNGFKDYGVRYK